MLTDKSKGFQKLIFDRIFQIQDEIIIHDPEYKELGKVPSELIRQLFAKLPDEDRKILDNYSSEYMKQLNRGDEIMYSRGLMDGIILRKWIERIERGEEKNIV